MRSRVDLPQPEGPTRTVNEPSAMSMSTPCRTAVSPKFLRDRLDRDAGHVRSRAGGFPARAARSICTAAAPRHEGKPVDRTPGNSYDDQTTMLTRAPLARAAAASPLVAERLSDRLAERLGQEIDAGRLRPGDRLPTEQRLADAHGVSRTVVREAVHQLQSRGLLRSRQGSGVYVTAPPARGAQARPQPDRLDRRRDAGARGAARARGRDRGARRRAGDAAAGRGPAPGAEGDRSQRRRRPRRRRGRPRLPSPARPRRPATRTSAASSSSSSSTARKRCASPGATTRPGPSSSRRSALEHRAIVDAIDAGDPALARRRAIQHMRGGDRRMRTAAPLAAPLRRNRHEHPDHRRRRLRRLAPRPRPARRAASSAAARSSALVLADQVAPRAELTRDKRVETRVGPLLGQCEALGKEGFDSVFHLASAVSGECEADFDLGLRSNLDTTRALLDALRAATVRGGKPAQAGLLQLGRGVRPRSVEAPARPRRRRHPARAEDFLRHAQADVRVPDRRLFAQGLHRRPLGAADDGDGAARPAERRRLVVLLRNHPRAARRRGGDLPGAPRRSRIRSPRWRARSRA